MWLIFALITFFAWGGADLFYKLGNRPDEPYSHLKTAVWVGLVMGVCALITLIGKRLPYDPRNLLIYLPVSLMYILSMVVGYFGLRYLEVSISSPVQNASGAVSALLLMLVLRRLPDPLTLAAMVLITCGVVWLGVLERRSEAAALQAGEKKYAIGFVAFLMPVIYCVIDSLGTFFDGWYLDDILTTPLVGVTEETLEDVANVSYQLTFLIAAGLLAIYLFLIRREPMLPKRQAPRLLAALLETCGQVTYVRALSGNGIAAAPLIGSYCAASLFFGRIFLKEKLEKKQILSVALIFLGIVLMGFAEALG